MVRSSGAIEEKYFRSGSSRLLIALGRDQYDRIERAYRHRVRGVSWASVDRAVLEWLSLVKHDTGEKVVTWIPHPSPGNTFYNPSKNLTGVMDRLLNLKMDLAIDNAERVIGAGCKDYPQLADQARQMVGLRLFLSRGA